MKKLNVLRAAALVLFVSLFASCSDNDNSSTDENNNLVEEHFDYTYDGQDVPVTILQAVRSEDRFAVNATTANGQQSIEIEFNKYGDLGEVIAITSSNWQAGFYYNKSEFFTFTLIEIDEENKTIEGTFSGKVYDEEYDVTSDFNTVSGNFKVVYTDQEPQVAGLHFDAKINGQDWYSTQNIQTGGFFSGSDLELLFVSDDKYELSLITNHDLTAEGTYSFGNTGAMNSLKFYVYDPELGYPTEGVVSNGALTISDKTVGPQYTFLSGTFSFTATNPLTGATVTVTNGTFKSAYENY
ncbi:DUF6252 family protein [Flavobacterium sp. RHBU_24]|uniref:DUF6252 family protein n=1 Tax=Flavobacterium sp. RHBU_24 TaxID=3391185 RepID=UPI0039849D73